MRQSALSKLLICFVAAPAPAATVPCDPRGDLKVRAEGTIRLRGTGQNDFQMNGRIFQKDHRQKTCSLTIPTGNVELTVPRTLRNISLLTASGNLDVGDIDGSLRAEASAGKVTIGNVGGDVEIHTAGGVTTIAKVGGMARCWSGGGPILVGEIQGDAVLETAGGDIEVRQVKGPVRASTNGGAIHIRHADGTVTANTAGGLIRVDNCGGVVTASNQAGPIQIGSARGVQCESSSGTINLTNVAGAMRANTSLGSIIAQFLPGFPALDSFLSTAGGDITVWIPSNLQISIRARNEGSANPRTVMSEFEGLRVRSSGRAIVAEGSLNGGGPLLRLIGSGGTIYIRKTR